jgi:hypothetical protein
MVFVLDPDPAADPLVEQRVVQQRRWPHVRVDPPFRGEDVLDSWRLHLLIISVPSDLIALPTCTVFLGALRVPDRYADSQRGQNSRSGPHNGPIPDRYRLIGPIANQRVDTPGQQSFHVRSVVDRPDLDFEAGLVRMSNEGG